jgi:hypothetical protein
MVVIGKEGFAGMVVVVVGFEFMGDGSLHIWMIMDGWWIFSR